MAALGAPATQRQARGTRTPRRPRPIVYPDSDGKPMGESDLHREEMGRLIHLLQAFFATRQDIYVTGDLILYYEEGNARVSVSPDVMVVKGVPAHWRETYLLWQEGRAPCFVIEVTSKSTRTVDERKKRDLYARLRVQEYILYDPRFPGLETASPPLRGYRLTAAGYAPLEADAVGALQSEELGLRLLLEDGILQCYDSRTGQQLLSVEEQAELAAEREAARAEREAARAEREAARAEREAARAEREAARVREAETRADAEGERRRLAEARVAELEALLRREQPPGE